MNARVLAAIGAFLILRCSTAWTADPALADQSNAVLAESGRASIAAGDFTRAMTVFRELSNRGDPVGDESVGALYMRGLGVAADPAEGFKWYRKAADKGLASARVALGAMYFMGQGVAKNDAEAVKWLELEPDNAQALHTLGLVYVNGGDAPKGLEALKRAAEKSYVPAIFDIARLHGQLYAAAAREVMEASLTGDRQLSDADRKFRSDRLARARTAERAQRSAAYSWLSVAQSFATGTDLDAVKNALEKLEQQFSADTEPGHEGLLPAAKAEAEAIRARIGTAAISPQPAAGGR